MCDRKTVSDGVSDHHSTDGGDRIEAESGTKGDQDNGKRNVLFGHPQRGRCCGKGEHHKKSRGPGLAPYRSISFPRIASMAPVSRTTANAPPIMRTKKIIPCASANALGTTVNSDVTGRYSFSSNV